MTGGVVIVGAGHAGLQAAASLRQGGFGERITLIGDEAHPPYQRPPLSKAFLKDEAADPDSLALRPQKFFADASIDRLDNQRVQSIDPAGNCVRLASGAMLDYDHLILATGAVNRPLPGCDRTLPNVLSLRSLDDAVKMRAALHASRSIAIVGGGFIGLEVASTALALGKSVVVLERMGSLMPRVLAPETSDYITRSHTQAGMDLRLGCCVDKLLVEDGRAFGLVLGDGGKIEADLIVVGIGAIPDTKLAADAGLLVDNGIVVDAYLRTSAPNIFAIGDCASFPLVGRGNRMVRIESVQNANDQARCVAAQLAGSAAPYDVVPWFWSDQFGFKLQIAGLSDGIERTKAVGDIGSGSFSVLGFAGDRLVCVESINRPADHMAARKLLRVEALPGFSDLDRSFDLAAFARGIAETA